MRALEAEFGELDGKSPEWELLRVFWLLSQTRPIGMGAGRIPIPDTLAAMRLTWLTAPPCVFAGWIARLDAVWMDDHLRKEKARQNSNKPRPPSGPRRR